MSRERSRFSPFVRQCFVTGAICLNTVGHACGVGYAAVLLPQLHRAGSEIPLTAQDDSWIASVVGISLFVGNFLTPTIMTRYGRRAAMYAVTIPVIVGWLCVIMAESVRALIIGRVLQGLSFGMILPVRSVMLGEYTSPRNRGAFLASISLAQAFGIFFVHMIGSFLSWQRTALVVIFFFFGSFIMVMFSPESPSFLASIGKYDESRKAHRWLRGYEEEEELEEMIENCLLIEKNRIELETSANYGSVKERLAVVKKKEFYKPIILMAHAYFMAQYSGGSTMANFPNHIIGGLLGSGANVNFWMVFLDAQRIATNTVAIFVINKVKRRTMLFGTGALSVFAHLSIGTYSYFKSQGTLFYDATWIPILLLNIQVFCVGLGMVPLPSVIAGEVFPLEYRSIAGSLSVVVLAVSLFVCLKTYMPMLQTIGLHGIYFVFSGILAYTLSVIWFLLPETKGRTLQQIEDEFRGRPLHPEEIEARQSLQTDPVFLKRIMSERKMSTATLIP